jgi:hypothetical protein
MNNYNTSNDNKFTIPLPPDVQERVPHEKCKCSSRDCSIYYIFRAIMTIIAIYLASTCAKGDTFSVIMAIIFPYMYILYSIYKYNGICTDARWK